MDSANRDGVGLDDFDDVPDLQIAIAERKLAALIDAVAAQQQQIRLLCGVIMGIYDDLEGEGPAA